MARPDPRILNETAIEVLQTMCTFLSYMDISSLAKTCKSMGDLIIYGTDDQRAKTAGAHLWRHHKYPRLHHKAARSFRPLRAVLFASKWLSQSHREQMVADLFHTAVYERRGLHDRLGLLSVHGGEYITIEMLKDRLCEILNSECVDVLLEQFRYLLDEPDLVYYAVRQSAFLSDLGWNGVAALIKAGANTDYVDPSGLDINDIARARGSYNKYRLAIKKGRKAHASPATGSSASGSAAADGSAAVGDAAANSRFA
jgi:hypothetical protein